jgi:hypothetical protein
MDDYFDYFKGDYYGGELLKAYKGDGFGDGIYGINLGNGGDGKYGQGSGHGWGRYSSHLKENIRFKYNG